MSADLNSSPDNKTVSYIDHSPTYMSPPSKKTMHQQFKSSTRTIQVQKESMHSSYQQSKSIVLKNRGQTQMYKPNQLTFKDSAKLIIPQTDQKSIHIKHISEIENDDDDNYASTLPSHKQGFAEFYKNIDQEKQQRIEEMHNKMVRKQKERSLFDNIFMFNHLSSINPKNLF